MKILIVEPYAARRAELVDWTCELPGFVIVDAVGGRAAAEALLATTHVDLILLGAVWPWTSEIPFVEAKWTMDELRAALVAFRSSKIQATIRSVDVMRLEHEREGRHASLQTLLYRLRAGTKAAPAETIDLHEWLPLMIERIRAAVPAYIEIVPIVAVDTAPVRCVARALEDVVYESVMRACAHLPWGGTVWVTAAPGADGDVTLDVLENGRGLVHDVRLRAAEERFVAQLTDR